MCLESSMALKELGSSIKTMTRRSSADTHITNSKAAVKSLKSLLQSKLWKETELLSVIPAVTVASLLIDIVECTEKIADSVNVLASIINFDTVDDINKSQKEEGLQSPTPPCECDEMGPKKTESESSSPHVVILVEELHNSVSDKRNTV